MDLTCNTVGPDGTATPLRIFQDIDENSTSYTFTSDSGILSSTQFTQPALTLMEIAIFRDMQARGLISNNSSYAGHSLGEYSALCAVANVVPLENLMSVVFYRGLTMQFTVKRDEAGRSDFAMCAVNPSRLAKGTLFQQYSKSCCGLISRVAFDGETLLLIVNIISSAAGGLLEVVNFNITNLQYVCAGNVGALFIYIPCCYMLTSSPTVAHTQMPDRRSGLCEQAADRFAGAHAFQIS